MSVIKRKCCLLLLAVAAVLTLKRRRKIRTTWMKKWLLRRQEGRGVLNMLENELRIEDPEAYHIFLRIHGKHFDELLEVVRKDISKQDTNMRECISAKQRLQLTLRYLATGETYRSLMFATRIHESTISIVIPVVCKAIYENLKEPYLKMPSSATEWEKVAVGFEQQWNFPQCIGAIDGKHINFQPPHSAGSYYHNYKGHHSIVLLAVCDSNYKFLYIDVGVNGRISDGGVYRESALKQALELNLLQFPRDKCLTQQNTPVPFTLVADDAFPLSKRIMKPYASRGLTPEKRIFNYRLSRARRCIENAFGILANRFRILLNTVNLSPDKVEGITLACCALHNFMIVKDPVNYTSNIDIHLQPKSLQLPQGPNRASQEALRIRECFKVYFNGPGAVPWQNHCLEE